MSLFVGRKDEEIAAGCMEIMLREHTPAELRQRSAEALDEVERGRWEVKALVCEGEPLLDAVEMGVDGPLLRAEVYERVSGWYIQMHGGRPHIKPEILRRMDKEMALLMRRACFG